MQILMFTITSGVGLHTHRTDTACTQVQPHQVLTAPQCRHGYRPSVAEFFQPNGDQKCSCPRQNMGLSDPMSMWDRHPFTSGAQLGSESRPKLRLCMQMIWELIRMLTHNKFFVAAQNCDKSVYLCPIVLNSLINPTW